MKRILSFILVMTIVLGISVSTFAHEQRTRNFLTNQVEAKVKLVKSNSRLIVHGEEEHGEIEENKEIEEKEEKDIDSKVEKDIQEDDNQVEEGFKLTRIGIITTGIIGFIFFLFSVIFYYWRRRSDNVNI